MTNPFHEPFASWLAWPIDFTAGLCIGFALALLLAGVIIWLRVPDR